MSERFGHDFSKVRVHTDSQASSLASSLNANAYTVGEEIVFAEGEYQPGTMTGDKLIAHELTHVAQQSLADGGGDGISSKDQPAEREAESASMSVIEGQAVDVQSAPQAAVSRDGDDNKSDSGGGFWSSVWGGLNAEGKKSQEDEKKIWTDLKGGHILDAGGDYMNSLVSDPLNMLKSGLNTGVDMAEKSQADSDKKLEDQTKDIPVLGSLIKGVDWMEEKTTEGVGGVVKGVGDIGAGLANSLAHPIDAVTGIGGIFEHNSFIPGMGTAMKAAHGTWDIAHDAIYGNPTNEKHEYGNSFGELADHLFNPMTQMKDDANFDMNLAQGIVDPEHKGLQGLKDKPVETITRAITNIAPMLMGAGEGEAGELGEAGAAAKPPALPEPAPVAPVDPALAPTQPVPAVPAAPAPGVPPTQPMTVVPGEPIAPAPGGGVPPTQPMTVPGAPVDPALAPTQPGVPPTQPMTPAAPPTPVDPMAPTQPRPVVPGETPPPGPTGPKNPVQQMPAVNPADVGPSAQPPPGVKNPVVQMPAVNPADVGPGAQPPPGWGTSAVDAPPKGPPPGWKAGPVGGPPPEPVPSTQMPSTQIPPSGPPTQPGMISPMADSVPAPGGGGPPSSGPPSSPPSTVPPSSGPPTQPGMISPMADSVPAPTPANPVSPMAHSVPAPGAGVVDTPVPSTQMPSTQMPSTQMPSTQVPSTTPMTAPGIGPPPDTIPGVGPPPNTVPGVGPPGPPLPGDQIPPTQRSPGVQPPPADAPPSSSQTPTPAAPDSPPSTVKDPPTQPSPPPTDQAPATKQSPGTPAPAPTDSTPPSSQAPTTTPTDSGPATNPSDSGPATNPPSTGAPTQKTPPQPGSPEWEDQARQNAKNIQINDPDAPSTQPAPAPGTASDPAAPSPSSAPGSTGDVQLGQQMSSSGWKGATAARNGFGVFEGNIPGVKGPVAIKVLPAGDVAGFADEVSNAKAAAATGYGPQFNGVVPVGEGKLGFAMEKIEGGFTDTPAGLKGDELVKAENEAAHYRSKVTPQTAADVQGFGDAMLKQGKYSFGDLQGLVTEDGHWRPIDFSGYKDLPDPAADPAEYQRAIDRHNQNIQNEASQYTQMAKENAAKKGPGP